jgi:hypothetical protein
MQKAVFILEWIDRSGKFHSLTLSSNEESKARSMNDNLDKKGAKGLLLSHSIEFTGTRHITWI